MFKIYQMDTLEAMHRIQYLIDRNDWADEPYFKIILGGFYIGSERGDDSTWKEVFTFTSQSDFEKLLKDNIDLRWSYLFNEYFKYTEDDLLDYIVIAAVTGTDE